MVLVNLSKIRESQGLTQKKLAEKLMFSERSVINWEGGKPTTSNNLKRIAIVLRVKPQELIN